MQEHVSKLTDTALLPKFLLEGKDFVIEYEGLHLLYFNCGKFGHVEKDYGHRQAYCDPVVDEAIAELKKERFFRT